MVRKVTIKYVSIRSSLVNLPLSLYGPLVSNRVRPQSLAIHISSSSPSVSAYLGWTGLASASSLAQFSGQPAQNNTLETVEIDPQLGSSLGLAEGSIVEIGLLHDLPKAKTIGTEPVSSDDWEILERHAGYVEENLLSQVRAAAVGQEVNIWVLGRTRVRLRVVSLDPEADAVLLSNDTEVSIAPKLHAIPKAEPIAHDQRPNEKPAQLKQPTGEKLVVRVLPNRFFPHIIVGEYPVVWVHPTLYLRLRGDLDHNPSKLSSVESSSSVTVRRLKPPAQTSEVKSHAATPAAPIQPRLLHIPSDGSKASTKAGIKDPVEANMAEVWLRWDSSIPDRQAVVHNVESIMDWDLICLGPVASKPQQPAPSLPQPTSSHEISPEPFQSNLAGVKEIMNQCHEFVIRSFALQGQNYSSLRPGSSGGSCSNSAFGLLLTGASGSGRTSIAKAVAKQLECDSKVFSYSIYVDLAKHSDESVSTLRSRFQHWHDLASWHKPSLVIFDNLDRVVAAEVEHADSSRARQLAEHFISIFTKRRSNGFVLFGTAGSQASLHQLLSVTHTFTLQITLKSPDKGARRDVLSNIVKRKMEHSNLSLSSNDRLNFTTIATQTEGYSASDLKDLVDRAVHQAVIRSSKLGENAEVMLTAEDFDSARADFVPYSLRDVKLQTSHTEWADIGGLQETRRVLRETLEWPTKYGAIFAKCPLRLRSGLLLYGYPGCGKTLLASAVAKECGLNFIGVKGPELLNKYIGASEKSVRDLFDRATAAKPCVLFFDEFDSIAPKRGHDSTGVTDRVVNQMLTQMDGAEGLDGVYVLAATSRPDLIDPALLRPGRLDKSLLCDMPDEAERKEILSALCRKVAISSSVDLHEYARATEGFSGADLQALIYNAHLEVVHSAMTRKTHTEQATAENVDVRYTTFGGQKIDEVLSQADSASIKRRLETLLQTDQSRRSQPSQTNPQVQTKRDIHDVHLRRSLASTRPSVPPEERARLRQIYQAFLSDRSGELPLPPDGRGVGNRASLM